MELFIFIIIFCKADLKLEVLQNMLYQSRVKFNWKLSYTIISISLKFDLSE